MNSITITPEPPDNIVAIDPAMKAELEITLRERITFGRCPGMHRSVLVDSKARTLTCQHCGFAVDPFEYVEAWAVEGDRRMTALKTIGIQKRVAETQLRDLERKIRNARAVLKRSGFPQPVIERREYDRQHDNAYGQVLRGEA